MPTMTCDLTLPLSVTFDYQPPEPAERGPEAQYPGCPESIAVEKALLGPFDITPLLTDEQLIDLCDQFADRLSASDYDLPY